MKIFAKKLQEQLETELSKVDSKGNALNGYIACIKLVKGAIEELKAYLIKHAFKDTAEEIFYFKSIAPVFYSRYIYFNKLCEVELNRLFYLEKHFLVFLEREEREIRYFYRRHREFHHYVNMDMSSQDALYFTRGTPVHLFPDDITIIMDENFSLASYWLSKLKAYDEYRLFLQRQKMEPDSNSPEENDWLEDREYTWKGSNADAAELIYAFRGRKLIEVNGREADIKDLTIMVKDFFGLELDNIYDTNLHNRKRKKDKAPFLNSLIQVYIGSI